MYIYIVQSYSSCRGKKIFNVGNDIIINGFILLFIISHLILLYPCNAHINNNHHHRQQQDDYHHHHHNRTYKCIHDHVKDIINNTKLSTKPDLYSNLYKRNEKKKFKHGAMASVTYTSYF